MKLPRQPPALKLLGLDDPAERVLRDSLGEVDSEGRAGRERLGEAQIGIREADVGPELVVSCQHANRASTDEQRHPEAGSGAYQTHCFVVDVGVVQDRVGALALATLEDPSALRGRARDRRARELCPVARHRRETQLVVAARKQNSDQAGIQ